MYGIINVKSSGFYLIFCSTNLKSPNFITFFSVAKALIWFCNPITGSFHHKSTNKHTVTGNIRFLVYTYMVLPTTSAFLLVGL